jgi:putative aldouronate transport system substrate-binding protein
MKRLGIAFLILMMVSSFGFAGGQKDAAPASSGDVTTIRFVLKDLSPAEEVNLQYLRNVEAGFEAWSGKKIRLEAVQMPEGAYAEKLNLMLLGGDIPDLIYFQGGDEVIANQGLLVDLNEYVKGSKIMQEVLLDFNKERMANYPYLLWLAPPRARTAAIREDWFEEAGGKVPETIDDYYNLFKTIKANHPEAAVITDTGNTDRMDFTFNQAFGITATWIKKGSGYVYSKVSEAEKKKLAFYQKLYTEGILDNGYITTAWDGMEDKLYTGQIAGAFATAGIVLDIYENKLMENQGVGLVALPPAKGVGRGYAVSTAKETRGWAISATSKNPDLVFELLEFMATDEGQIMDRFGVEGVHFNRTGGQIAKTDKASEWWPKFHEVMVWEAPIPLMGPEATKSWDFIAQYAVGDPDFPIPEEYSATWDALENLYKEYSYKIISGEYPISKFDEFVSKWYDLGGDKITAYAEERLK